MPDDGFPKSKNGPDDIETLLGEDKKEFGPGELSDDDVVGYVTGTLSPEDLAKVEEKISSSPKLAKEMSWLKTEMEIYNTPKGKSRLERMRRNILIVAIIQHPLTSVGMAEFESRNPDLVNELNWLRIHSAEWEKIKDGGQQAKKIRDLLMNRKYESH